MKFSLHFAHDEVALQSRFSRVILAVRPASRRSIRGRPYGANTCSLHCGHSHSHSARSPRSGSHARSCCSRTTIASTGRSTGASQPTPLYTERRCASASPQTRYVGAGRASPQVCPRCVRLPSTQLAPPRRARTDCGITTVGTPRRARDRCRVTSRPARARVLAPEIEHPLRDASVIVAAASASSHSAREQHEIRRAARGRPRSQKTGGVLLSQVLAGQVPSALRGLTALFGMGRGVSPSPKPPENIQRPPLPVLQNCTAPQQASKISVKPSTH